MLASLRVARDNYTAVNPVVPPVNHTLNPALPVAQAENNKIPSVNAGSDSKNGVTDNKDESDHVFLVNTYNAKIEASLAKAQELNLSPISYEEYMKDISTGNRQGLSLERQKAKLLNYKADLIGVRDGTVAPKKIIGTGYKNPKKVAISWLEREIAELEADISTNSFSNTINLGNYSSYLSDFVRTGKDTSYTSDEEIEQDKIEREERQTKALAEQQKLDEKANQYKKYTLGSKEGIRNIQEVKFTLSNPSSKLLIELGEATSVHDKYILLGDKTEYSGVKRQQMQFNREVELNFASKYPDSFKYFELSPRKGYSVATFGVDIDTANSEKHKTTPQVDVQAKEAQKQAEAQTPQVQEIQTENNNKEEDVMSPHVNTLHEIIEGKHDNLDLSELGALIDVSYDALEKENKLNPEIEKVLNDAADHLTTLLRLAAQEAV